MEPEVKPSSTSRHQELPPAQPVQPLPRTIVADDEDENEDEIHNDDATQSKDKKSGTNIRAGVKNLVKSGLDNIKSVLPTHLYDSKDKEDVVEPKRKGSTDSVESIPHAPESPSLIDKFKNRFKRATSPPTASDQSTSKEKPSNYESLWQASSQQQQGRTYTEYNTHIDMRNENKNKINAFRFGFLLCLICLTFAAVNA